MEGWEKERCLEGANAVCWEFGRIGRAPGVLLLGALVQSHHNQGSNGRGIYLCTTHMHTWTHTHMRTFNI